MYAKTLLAMVVATPLSGCSALHSNDAASTRSIDAELHEKVVAELFGVIENGHAKSRHLAPGPSLVAGDTIALAWLHAHNHYPATESATTTTRQTESAIPAFDDARMEPNLALWTPTAWDMLGF